MVFLVSVLSVLAKNLTAFLIVASLIEEYMLIATTDAIVTSSLNTFFLPIFLSGRRPGLRKNVNISLFLCPGTS